MKKINKKALSADRQGFTLVELLLVIAIIGILAAVLFVSLGKQRDRARMSTFKENMRGIATAATACRDGGGTVQDVQGGDVCDPANDIGIIPEIPECDGGDATLATFGVADGDKDFWLFTADCMKADGTVCSASCNVNGCVYTDCE